MVRRPPKVELLELNVPDYAGLNPSLQSRYGVGAWQRHLIPWDHDLALLHQQIEVRMTEQDRGELPKSFYFPDELTFPQKCYRNKAAWHQYPVCNTIHELPTIHTRATGIQEQLQNSHDPRHRAAENSAGQSMVPGTEAEVKFLSRGHYRDSWLITSCGEPARGKGPTATPKCTRDESVLKTLREGHDFDYYQMRQVAQEAIVMEELTASPRIVDIRGHCATTILAEYLPGEITTRIVPDRETGSIKGKNRGRIPQTELDQLQENDVYPLNNFTALEKVMMALRMAESVADLHGLKSGIFVHGDVHPDQWLMDGNGALKLNDFNNGKFLDYDPGEMEYCKYRCQFGGTYKTPEEIRGDYVDESVDTWAIGHGIYGLLTGLYPFYDFTSHPRIRQIVMDGVQPFVDDRYRTRSFIEGELVKIMEDCWRFQSKNRPSIFEIVQYLRDTIQQSKNPKDSESTTF
jgi:serine/threonine protein kinase